MANNCGFSREAVRVKVKKCEGQLTPEWRKFSVDPQITSLEVLVSILAKAFDLRGDFNVSYKTTDSTGQDIYAVVLSDWDLDAAFLRAHNTSITNKVEPCLYLRVDIKPFSESSEDPEWDSGELEAAHDASERSDTIFTSNSTVNANQITNNIGSNINHSEKKEFISGLRQHKFPGIFKNQVEKTLSMVQKALNLVDTVDSWNWHPNDTPPLGDAEFRGLLDAVGRLSAPQRLKRRVYSGGVEPNLRRVVWKHVLNVYPDGMSGRDRISYIKRKSLEYFKLRDTWRDVIQHGPITPQLSYVTSMVRKDVLRTDRHHPFYGGSDDNKNIAALFNILTTYALNHKVSYCQGMSDLASPLLVTMNDESHAYICFCALMKRLSGNFMLDGIAMTQKFTHLSEAILYYDPEFYAYLKQQQADDLLFCYRWLLLEMKREFCFEDSLRMLEVLWSSIPLVTVPDKELDLFEFEFKPVYTVPDTPIVPCENAYTKVCALRRQSSAMNLGQNINNMKFQTSKRLNLSLDENRGRCKFKNALQDIKTVSMDDTVLQIKKGNSVYNADKGISKEPKNIKSTSPIERPKSVSPKKGDDSLSRTTERPLEIISNSMNDLAKKSFSVKKPGCHFRELKDKISAAGNSRKSIFSMSLDKIEVRNDKSTECMNKNVVNTGGGKVVKNLNEFLNFNKSRLSEKFVSKKIDQSPSPSNDSSFTDNKTKISQKQLHKDLSVEGSSSPDDSQEYFPMTTSMTRELRLELENLDRQVFGRDFHNKSFQFDNTDSPTESESIITEQNKNFQCDLSNHSSITEISEPTELAEICSVPQVQVNGHKNGFSKENSPNDIFLWENPLHKQQDVSKTKFPTTPDEQADLEYDGESGEIFEESQGKKSITPIRLLKRTHNSNRTSDSSESENDWKLCDTKVDYKAMGDEKQNEEDIDNKFIANSEIARKNEPTKHNNMDNRSHISKTNVKQILNENNFNDTSIITDDAKPLMLPPPNEFGGGNPFLMFLCLTVLLQHRDYVMRNNMDYNEMAMHFDKMVRKHNINRVLNQARKMYTTYLKQQNGNDNSILK